MNFGELMSGAASGGLNYLQSQLPGGSASPVPAQQAPMPSVRSGSGMVGTGIGLGGIVVAYFILRFLGLLPRWMRII